MAYYKPKNNIINTYNNESIAFNVNKETKDTYSVDIFQQINIETNEILECKCEVVKNWTYGVKPKVKVIEGKKYREVLLKSSSLKECYDFIDLIIQTEGYWDKHPTESFKEIFIEPVI